MSVPLLIVSASRLSGDAFASSTPLGVSLQKEPYRDCQRHIRSSNHEPLGLVYNAAIDAVIPEAVIVFVHDDMWLSDQPLAPFLLEALNQLDVIGVACNCSRLSNQKTWWTHAQSNQWDWNHLVGAVAHGSPNLTKHCRYGPTPAEASLLDGVFLTARASTLHQHPTVCFDPNLSFHFYDLDFCRSAKNAGLALGVWSIPLIHKSGGYTNSASWRNALWF